MTDSLSFAGILIQRLPGGTRRLTHPSGVVAEESPAVQAAHRKDVLACKAEAEAELAAMDAMDAQIAELTPVEVARG